MKTREEALQLLNEWVSSESLKRHCLGVAVCMEAYARKFLNEGKLEDDGEVDKWWICGLLHDFDYEKYPNINEHPIKGCFKLRELGYDEEIIEAILGHNPATGIPRMLLMAKTLFAVDELSGLVYALAKVRPGNFEGMSSQSVKKAMKKKDFAAAISREDIELGMKDLDINEENTDERSKHLELVINAMNSIKGDLGLANKGQS